MGGKTKDLKTLKGLTLYRARPILGIGDYESSCDLTGQNEKVWYNRG